MTKYMIDRDGCVLHPSQYINQKFGVPISTGRVDFLIRMTGCAYLDVGETSVALHLAPGEMPSTMYGEVSRLLGRAQPDRVLLRWYDGEWHHEIVRGAKAALSRVLELAAARRVTNRFFLRGRKVETLHRNHPFHALIDLWKDRSGELCLSDCLETIHAHTDSRFLTVGTDENQALRFTSFGHNWQVYKSKNWLIHCLGERVEDQPDVAYGRWVGEAYRTAMLAGAPTIRDVDVIVSDPTGGGERRIQYNRLSLPVVGPDGKRGLLSAPFLDSGIDLRTLPIE